MTAVVETAGPERAPPMRNLAGAGRAGWQLLGVDEEYGTPVMALDMTGGQVTRAHARV